MVADPVSWAVLAERLGPVRVDGDDGALGWYEALPTPVDGLVVVLFADGVSLTHLSSGRRLAGWSLDGAETLASYLLDGIGPLGIDWTLGAEELRRRFGRSDLPDPRAWGGDW